MLDKGLSHDYESFATILILVISLSALGISAFSLWSKHVTNKTMKEVVPVNNQLKSSAKFQNR